LILAGRFLGALLPGVSGRLVILAIFPICRISVDVVVGWTVSYESIIVGFGYNDDFGHALDVGRSKKAGKI